MQTYPPFRIQILITGLLLFGTCVAMAQNDGGATFTPTIDQKLDARSTPAKVTSDDESALVSKGYIKIGTISASHPGKKANAEATEELESAILQKAAEAGGDIVSFSKEGIPEEIDVPTGKTKIERKCLEEKSVAVSAQTGKNCIATSVGPNCSPVMGTRTVSTCVSWGPKQEVPVTRHENNLVSEATVWRNDPTLAADVARAAEAAEARRKAEAAEAAEAARKKEVAEVESLLAPGADINARDNDGKTMLIRAVWGGKRDLVELLLAHGADVNAKDSKYGDTPLCYAVEFREKDLAEVLLAHGADVNAKDSKYGQTPLHVAVNDGNKEMVELLLAHRADVNAKAANGQTPLHLAASFGRTDIAELLLDHGADVNARDDHQWTPLIQAASASQESKKMVEALLAHGADINAMAMNGYTPLIEAAMMGHRDVVEIFLAHGADVNAKEEGQYTAFRWAMSGNHQDIVDLLRQHGGHE